MQRQERASDPCNILRLGALHPNYTHLRSLRNSSRILS
jgi:hypothetical protein